MSDYYTLYNLKADVNRKTHGVGVDQATDFYSSADEGRRQLIAKVRPPELVRTAYLEQALYDQVDKYAVPDDLKYEDIIEIRKLSSDKNVDTMEKPLQIVYRRKFDQKRWGTRNTMAIVRENGIKYAKINHPRGLQQCQHQLINKVDSLSDNGTWNVGGNVVNLRLDKLLHVTGKASIRFDIDNSSTTGFLENFTMDAVNLADFLETGSVFAWLNLPLPKELLAVKITLGSTASNLATDIYELTVNQPHDNNEFIEQWNLLKYQFYNMVATGNPNPRAIVYVRFDFTTTGNPIPECNLDNIIARKGVVYEVTYNSRYNIMDADTKVWKKIATKNSDFIIAEEDTYQLYMLETSLSVQKEIYANAGGAQSDITAIDEELNGTVIPNNRNRNITRGGLYNKYKLEHKSEAIEETNSTYIFGEMYSGLTDEPENQYQGDYGGGDDDSPEQNQCC